MSAGEHGARSEPIGERMPVNNAILTLKGVSKSFEGVHALVNVGFEVRSGHIKALIGPNGAGKTTLLNVINGLLVPDSGNVTLKGRSITGMKTDQIAVLGVSRTFQLVRLFTVNDATVLDNVLIGGHKRLNPTITGTFLFRGRTRSAQRELREKAMEALSFVGMEWAAHHVPTSLSFGNQRLVELARSLVSDPELLLLDEPASGLNDAEVEQFMELLLAIRKRGITVLLVEHNMNLVMRVSDDVVVLDFGKWLAEGDPASICANAAVIEAYLGSECAFDRRAE